MEISTEKAEENKLISFTDEVQEQNHQGTSKGGRDNSNAPFDNGSAALVADVTTGTMADSSEETGSATAEKSATAAAEAANVGLSAAPVADASTATVDAAFGYTENEAAEYYETATAEVPNPSASDALVADATTAPVTAAADDPVAAASAQRRFNEHIFTGLHTGLSLMNVDVLVVGRGSGTPSLVQYISKDDTTAEITDYPVSNGKFYKKEVNLLHGYPRFFTGQKVLVVLPDVVVSAEVKGLVSCTKRRGN